jgi:hypothetical protein
LCIILGYLRAKSEAQAVSKKHRLLFPHSLRLLYSASGWQERFSQLMFVLALLNLTRLAFRFYEANAVINHLAAKSHRLIVD